MSVTEVDVYFREPSDTDVGKLLGRVSLERLPSLDELFDTSVFGDAAPAFPVKVGSIRHNAPRGKITVIPA